MKRRSICLAREKGEASCLHSNRQAWWWVDNVMGSMDLDGDGGFYTTTTLSTRLKWWLNGWMRQRSTFWNGRRSHQTLIPSKTRGEAEGRAGNDLQGRMDPNSIWYLLEQISKSKTTRSVCRTYLGRRVIQLVISSENMFIWNTFSFRVFLIMFVNCSLLCLKTRKVVFVFIYILESCVAGYINEHFLSYRGISSVGFLKARRHMWR